MNAARLTSDGRTQFDAARRFVQQSEDALKARNLLYAGKLADKAAPWRPFSSAETGTVPVSVCHRLPTYCRQHGRHAKI